MTRRAIAAVDASLTGFATCFIDAEDAVFLRRTVTKPATKVLDRMRRYDDLITPLVVAIRLHSPSVLFIEGYSYGSKGDAVTGLAEMGGILRYRCMQIVDDIVEVPPSVIKKFATGKGNASKLLVVQSLAKRYDRIFETDDEADAFALAQLGMVVSGYREAETAFQQQAADTIKSQ